MRGLRETQVGVYLDGTRLFSACPGRMDSPLTHYELKAGAVIPAVMISGINSDLPGQILAQVAEDVYDTATGRYLVIPQGSKLVGTYDNEVLKGGFPKVEIKAWREFF